MPDADSHLFPSSAEEHEFHYNPQRAFPDFAASRETRAPANAKALASLTCDLDVAYGEHPLRRLDIFRAAGAADGADGELSPVHLFFHGGYWRGQDKAAFSLVAGLLAPLGVTTVIVNYELCPASTLDEVADSAIAATQWVHRHAGRYGGDANHVTISGHSAGAHLVGEVLAADWRARGIDPGFLKGALQISGIFDPTPAMTTSVNADLRLTPEIAARRNVEQRPPLVDCPVRLFAGGREPWRWIDQTFRYSHHLRRHGRDPAVEILPGYDHFDILNEFLSPDTSIGAALVAMATGSTTRRGDRR